jgi:DNA-binding response OmpR family regulator
MEPCKLPCRPPIGDHCGMARIFLVEGNGSIREAVYESIERTPPDLVLLDVMLPDGNGFALAKRIRAVSLVPLVFLTAKEAESDRITGLDLCADDYVVKPFSPKELVLRVRALLRRSGQAERMETGGLWVLGETKLRMGGASHRVTAGDAESSERTVDTHVRNLQAKLGDQDWIETVRGYGYRFAGQATARD